MLPENDRFVHFILTGGELTPDYRRAIISARVHEAPIILWHVAPVITSCNSFLRDLNVETRHIELPFGSTLLNEKNKAHLYDVLAWLLASKHSGLFIGLDTISIKPAWDLYPTPRVADFAGDLVVSQDWPDDDPLRGESPYNNNFIAGSNCVCAKALFNHSIRLIRSDEELKWGATGPLLLNEHRNLFIPAPYPTLCGWSPGYIWRFYLGLERPDPSTRVIHLCKTAYIDLYEGRYDEWARKYPAYAGMVAARTDLNADLLALP